MNSLRLELERSAVSPLIEVRNLVKHFDARRRFFGDRSGPVRAVDDVSFVIAPGETLGLIGESGCGKSTLARVMLGLTPATSGEVLLEGNNSINLKGAERRKFRRACQIIFQDPLGALDPRQKVGDAVAEALEVHDIEHGVEAKECAAELFKQVGLRPELMRLYARELSGGQRQRVLIARALAVKPKFLVADESVSALDVSVQAQIINLLQDLQDEFGLTYLFIAHGLAVVRQISDRVGVMYLGSLVEVAPSGELFAAPAHPYTKGLIAAVPIPDPARRRPRLLITDDVQSVVNIIGGCRFRRRCPLASELCEKTEPRLREISPQHWVACHFAEEG